MIPRPLQGVTYQLTDLDLIVNDEDQQHPAPQSVTPMDPIQTVEAEWVLDRKRRDSTRGEWFEPAHERFDRLQSLAEDGDGPCCLWESAKEPAH